MPGVEMSKMETESRWNHTDDEADHVGLYTVGLYTNQIGCNPYSHSFFHRMSLPISPYMEWLSYFGILT
jgi:hypothetical protein